VWLARWPSANSRRHQHLPLSVRRGLNASTMRFVSSILVSLSCKWRRPAGSWTSRTDNPVLCPLQSVGATAARATRFVRASFSD
jgi:hypothetical protein